MRSDHLQVNPWNKRCGSTQYERDSSAQSGILPEDHLRRVYTNKIELGEVLSSQEVPLVSSVHFSHSEQAELWPTKRQAAWVENIALFVHTSSTWIISPFGNTPRSCDRLGAILTKGTQLDTRNQVLRSKWPRGVQIKSVTPQTGHPNSNAQLLPVLLRRI